MFCGWGHPRSCRCEVCYDNYHLTRKQAYRKALALSKISAMEAHGMPIRKPVPGEFFGVPDTPFDDEAFKGDFPNLYEYLTLTRWQDGSIRQTSTLTIFIDNRALKIVINDRDNQRSAFFNARTWGECLVKLETALSDDTVDWKSKGGVKKDAEKIPW